MQRRGGGGGGAAQPRHTPWGTHPPCPTLPPCAPGYCFDTVDQLGCSAAAFSPKKPGCIKCDLKPFAAPPMVPRVQNVLMNIDGQRVLLWACQTRYL